MLYGPLQRVKFYLNPESQTAIQTPNGRIIAVCDTVDEYDETISKLITVLPEMAAVVDAARTVLKAEGSALEWAALRKLSEALVELEENFDAIPAIEK